MEQNSKLKIIKSIEMKTKLLTTLCAIISLTIYAQKSSSCDAFYFREELNAELVEIGTLSEARSSMSVASSANKLFFAGGTTFYPNNSTRVDIYDIDTQSWTTAELSVGRFDISAISNNNKVFFAGGETGDGTSPVDNVDIYNILTDTWTTDHLSSAGNSIRAATVGNKVLFIGGDGGFVGVYRETRVDIYDQSTGLWSTSSLNEVKRGGHVAVTLGDKVYIAGGESWTSNTAYSWFVSDEIDIYDSATNTWSVNTMYENKISFAGIALNDKIYWAGGRSGSRPYLYSSNVVEIWDPITGTSTIECLRLSENSCFAGQLKDKIVFLTNPSSSISLNFDIYDTTTKTWYYIELPRTIPVTNFITVNNTIYMTGWSGPIDNRVVKLYRLNIEFPLSITEVSQEKVSIYPNPVTDILNIASPAAINNVNIYDLMGREVQNLKLIQTQNNIQLDMRTLPAGIYFVKVSSENMAVTDKVIKK